MESRELLLLLQGIVLAGLGMVAGYYYGKGQGRREADASWETISYQDVLTGVYNRRFLERQLQECKNHHRSCGILVCDVDGLKEINDTYGHLAGDEWLRKAAAVLKSSLRKGDVVVRAGGDEFVALLPEASAELLEQLCERIRCKAKLQTKGTRSLGLSIGKALVQPGCSIKEALKRADLEMYQEKHLNKKHQNRLDRTTV